MKSGSILVLNAGSSSLKFSLFRLGGTPDLKLMARGEVKGLGSKPEFGVKDASGSALDPAGVSVRAGAGIPEALDAVGAWLRRDGSPDPVVAVGHRVVHGGIRFEKPVIVDEQVRSHLEQLVSLAPLHQPHNLAVLDAARKWAPDVVQVACFDTAFHRTHSTLADLYALPWELHEAGVRRYGFHGLSYEYVASALPAIAPELDGGRVIVAHLGSGASLCALKAGRSVNSTMGFSTLDGVPMGTRTGAIDPGVLLYLLRGRGYSVEALERLLYHESGLLGLSGVSSDMRELLESDQPRARLAIDHFVWRTACEIGSLVASLGGVEGIVFTAGIGENSPVVRERIMEACRWLGLTPDAEANVRGGPRLSAGSCRVSAWVVPTNEELMIARHTLAVIGDGKRPPDSLK